MVFRTTVYPDHCMHLLFFLLEVTSVIINSVPSNFSYQDSVADAVGMLKEGTASNHQDFKRRWSMATAEDDEGELTVYIPKGMVIPNMVCKGYRSMQEREHEDRKPWLTWIYVYRC